MRKRNIRIQVRLNDIEYAKLLDDISKSKSNISDYIRKLILNKEVKEKPDYEFLKILNQLSKIGVNINQIAHIANATGKIETDKYNKESNTLFSLVKDLKRKYL